MLMLEMIKMFLKRDGGASMAEYAILCAAITGVLVTIIGLYTHSIENVFSYIRNQLDAARQAAAS